jgi:prevent-host-death family protein
MATRVGVRDLRHRLREYLARVRAGERFEITVFDRPVAELVPLGGGAGTLERLVEEGRLTPALESDTVSLPPLVPPAGPTTATDALLAERREDPR